MTSLITEFDFTSVTLSFDKIIAYLAFHNHLSPAIQSWDKLRETQQLNEPWDLSWDSAL